MPINEVPTYQSSLSEKQQREALAAAYRLDGAPMIPTTTELTYEERVKMRRMLDELDQKQAGGMKEFDLNKPPVPPYVYREYPFLMYHHQSGQAKAAVNHEQRLKMAAEGWSETPVPIESPQVELTATELMQAAELDRQLKMPRESLEADLSVESVAALKAELAALKAGVPGAEPEPETEKSSRNKRSK